MMIEFSFLGESSL